MKKLWMSILWVVWWLMLLVAEIYTIDGLYSMAMLRLSFIISWLFGIQLLWLFIRLIVIVLLSLSLFSFINYYHYLFNPLLLVHLFLVHLWIYGPLIHQAYWFDGSWNAIPSASPRHRFQIPMHHAQLVGMCQGLGAAWRDGYGCAWEGADHGDVVVFNGWIMGR